MLRLALAQLRGAIGRTIALLVAITVATASFTVLTGAVSTTRLQVRDTVTTSFRNSYDLLVRPPSSYTPREGAEGLVRPNYQSGVFGGITTAQLDAIRGIDSVEVAAPVANIGYVNVVGSVRIDLGRLLDGARQQLFRVRPVFSTDRGTTRFLGTPVYVYVSRNRAVLEKGGFRYGTGDDDVFAGPTWAERIPGRGETLPSCANYLLDQQAVLLRREGRDATYSATPFGYRDPYASTATSMTCYYLPTRPTSKDQFGAADPRRLEAVIPVSLPVLLTAIDPVAEDAISGLGAAVTSGRTLAATDVAPGYQEGTSRTTQLPVLAADTVTVDQQVSADLERVDASSAELTATMARRDGLLARLARLDATRVGAAPAVTAASTWTDVMDRAARPGDEPVVGTYWQVGPSQYTDTGGTLGVVPVPNPASRYVSPQLGDPAPVGSDDSGVREVTEQSYRQGGFLLASLRPVGRFDATKVLGDDRLSGLTSPTYASPLLPGADAASRSALGDQPLAPSSNVAGYAAQPPALLTTLAAAGPLLNAADYGSPEAGAVLEGGELGHERADPISVVRVRVAGITGPDPVSRERLNQAALAIAQRTGLAVDIVAGASGVATTVVLPAGEHGRPQLALEESWAKKGLAYAVVAAVDRKSLTLFLLILTVCTLVVSNAASASVRTRRVGLGVLSCLGWNRARLFGVVMVELAVVGLVAGLVGAGLAIGVGATTGLPVTPRRALLAVPPAVLLAVLAGLAPALRAARATPMDAVRPLVRPPRRGRRTVSVTDLALHELSRTPGRTALAAVSLAVGVAALTVVLAVQQVFRGLVVGSLLGDAVALQVRAPDVVALGTILLLGLVAVGDVLYLSLREQAPQLAVLRATGWSEAALARLVVVQGLGIGVLGSVLGVAAGLLAVAGLTGGVPGAIVGPVGLSVAAGCVVAALAALVPGLLVRRLPTTTLLAEDPA